MENIKNLNMIDLITFAVATLIASACLFLLVYFGNFFFTATVAPEDVIAEVIDQRNLVKRKLPVDFEYLPVYVGMPLGNGDSLFTGNASIVAIKFKNSTTLLIGQNSLVEIRLIDGRIDVRIDQGEASGVLAKNEKIELHSEDESIVINGQEEMEFTVKTLQNSELELTQIKTGVVAKKRAGTNKSKPENDPKKRDPASRTSGKSNEGGYSRNQNLTQSLGISPQTDNLEVVEKTQQLTKGTPYKLPYPEDDKLFLHTSDEVIPIFPKKRCLSICEMQIRASGRLLYTKVFSANSTPVAYLKVHKDTETKISWQLDESGKLLKGTFRILKYTDINLREAIEQNRNIEVLD